MEVDELDAILSRDNSTESITKIFINTINIKLGDFITSYKLSNNINTLRLPKHLLFKFQQGLEHFLLTKDFQRFIDDWKEDYAVKVEGVFLSNEVSKNFCIKILNKMPIMIVENEEQPTDTFYNFIKTFVDTISCFSYKYFDEHLTLKNGDWLKAYPFSLFDMHLCHPKINHAAYMQAIIKLLPSSDDLETMNIRHENLKEEVAHEEHKILKLGNEIKPLLAGPKVRLVLKLQAELKELEDLIPLQSHRSIFLDEKAWIDLVKNSLNLSYLQLLYILCIRNEEIESLKEDIAQIETSLTKYKEISTILKGYELSTEQIMSKEEEVHKSREMLLNAMMSYQINESRIRATKFIIFVKKNIKPRSEQIPTVMKEMRIVKSNINIREEANVNLENKKDHALLFINQQFDTLEETAFSIARFNPETEDIKERLRKLKICCMELMMEEEFMLKKKLLLENIILSNEKSSIHCEDYCNAKNFKTILGEKQYFGILLRNIRINEEYKFALTAALKNNLYIHIVLRKNLLPRLKLKVNDETWSKTTFITLDSIKDKKNKEIVGAKSLSEVGISGGSPEGLKVAKYLLLGSYLCNSLEEANEVSLREPLIKCFLTRGEMIIKGVVSPLKDKVPIFNADIKRRKLSMGYYVKECINEMTRLDSSLDLQSLLPQDDLNVIIKIELPSLIESVEKFNNWRDLSDKILLENLAEIAGEKKAEEILFKYYNQLKNPDPEFTFDKIEYYIQKMPRLKEAVNMYKADYQQKSLELALLVLDKYTFKSKFISLILKNKYYPDIKRDLKRKKAKLAALEKAQNEQKLKLNELKVQIQGIENIIKTDTERSIYFKTNELEILKQSSSSDLNNYSQAHSSIQEVEKKLDELSTSRKRGKEKCDLLLVTPIPPEEFPSAELAQEAFAPFFNFSKGQTDGVDLWSGKKAEIIESLISQINIIFLKFYPDHLICNNKITHTSEREINDPNELQVVTPNNEVLKVEHMSENLKYALYTSIFLGCCPKGGPLIFPNLTPFGDDLVDILKDLPSSQNQIICILPD